MGFFYGVFMSIAYSYRRFSSKGQEQGDSIRRQTELAEKYCIEHRLELSNQTYEDLGVSAWTGSNSHEDAGLGQFLKACELKKIPEDSVLLVESLDRLSREKIMKAMTQLMSITRHIDVVTLVDNRRYTSDMDFSDIIIAGATMVRANEESEIKSKRISAVWEAKRRDPKRSKKTRKCPFWLDVTDDNMDFVVNEKVEIVREAYRLSAEGLGNMKVAKYLNSKGFRTARDKDWSPANVSVLLKARTVLGEYQPCKVINRKAVSQGDPVVDYYPQVIDTELFNKVQICISDRARNIRMGSTSSHRNLIRSNGRCMCGGELFITSKRQGVAYFQCQNKTNSECSHSLFRYDVFLQFIREQVIRPMYFRAWAIDDSSNEHESKRDALVVQRNIEQSKLDALLELDLSNPSITLKIGVLANQVEKFDSEILEVEQQIAKSKLGNFKFESLDTMLKLTDVAGEGDSTEKQISARVQLNRMLSNFKIELGSNERKSLVYIEYFDQHKQDYSKQLFQTKTTAPSRAIKKKKMIWELIDLTLNKQTFD
ncbi:hypothetical protein BCT04_17285 [Vibrio breoganii]|uniref:recombinase family protein n=1 Tax=Vibrio breoganii TaxID=553239 RepID=UPI000C83AAAD|nr:recombinase family protein [Vibrio breoganii]PMM17519.1 hypothetical protein BCT59_14025 [Vibrio breoganii]PMO61555.1 hypothetical protein BCT04_17285 [Vibrio breoganii]